MIERIKLKAIEIINSCNESLKNNESPNKKIIELILREFKNNLEAIESSKKVTVLNPKREIWACKVINDSADYDFDKDLFLKVREFQDLCKKVDKNYLIFQFN